jgi:hypothetical protein
LLPLTIYIANRQLLDCHNRDLVKGDGNFGGLCSCQSQRYTSCNVSFFIYFYRSISQCNGCLIDHLISLNSHGLFKLRESLSEPTFGTSGINTTTAIRWTHPSRSHDFSSAFTYTTSRAISDHPELELEHARKRDIGRGISYSNNDG